MVIHDFPYEIKGRKCPHTSLVSLTNVGGCIYACPMCYARAYLWALPDRIKIYKNLPEKLEKEIKNLKLAFPFYLSQITDPLQPITEIRNITYRVIKILIRYRLSFRIVTKSAEGVRELIKEIPELITYPFFFLEMTVESTPAKQTVTSPNASRIIDRISALNFLNDLGIETIARTDPTILGLMEREDLIYLLEQIKNTGVHHIVASTGYYNRNSMECLLSKLHSSRFRDCARKVIDYYKYNPNSKKKRFMADFEIRKRFHEWFKKEVEARGMTYAVCQELPREFDSEGIPTCEGSKRNPVQIRHQKGNFIAIECAGDCLRFCPDLKKPPCGIPALATEYPYKIKTIQLSLPSLFFNQGHY